MSYDKSYFIANPDFDKPQYEVFPTEESSQRSFHYKKLNFGESPVSFIMEDEKLLDSLPLMIFCTPSFFISKELVEVFDGKIYSGQLYPALINGKDGYYLINIFNELDCWDRNSSVYENDDIDDDPHVIKYSLSKGVLDGIPENERLIFRMGGDDLAPLVVHSKIKKLIESKVDNINFFMIENYQLGDEY